MRLEWSAAALADLDGFAAFLQEHHPALASTVAQEILAKARVLETHPQLGYPIVADNIGRSCWKYCERNTFSAIALLVIRS
jgi:plasmid stabilization system protein ParE